MNFHVRVAEAPTLVKQTAVYTRVLKSIASKKTRKSTPHQLLRTFSAHQIPYGTFT